MLITLEISDPAYVFPWQRKVAAGRACGWLWFALCWYRLPKHAKQVEVVRPAVVE